MTLTDTVQNLWDQFNTTGWQNLVAILVGGFLLVAVLTVFHILLRRILETRPKTYRGACIRAALSFLAVVVVVFWLLYDSEGHWERHFFSADIWKPDWARIVTIQFVACILFGIVALCTLEESWRAVMRRRASSESSVGPSAGQPVA